MRAALASILCLAAHLGAASPCKPDPPPPPPTPFFTNRTIYAPPKGMRALYPRIAELRDGTLLVTASVFGLSVFPVFESKDGGASWAWISNITDQVNGWGMSAQPALLELREPLGGFKPGTILASGNSWSGTGTRIDLYASTDGARSWQFVSHVASGGPPNTTNGATPVWEPFLLYVDQIPPIPTLFDDPPTNHLHRTYDHELIVYYSDQRDPLHGQKLAHQRSRDLKTWGDVVNDVAYTEYLARPGMSIVAHIPPLKKWILTYELPIGNSSSYGKQYPVHYRLADDPREFDSAEGLPVVVDHVKGENGEEKLAGNASPYVVWSPEGGKDGTIVVSDADRSEVFVNRRGGDTAAWELWETGQPDGYSRALHVFEKHPDRLAVIGGDTFNGNGWGGLSLTVLDLKKGGKPGPKPGV
jgi:hypothetical protein